MVVTTWDGHVRVDFVPAFSLLRITLATVQPTKESALRQGLHAGFVSDDPDGPPAFVEVRVEGGRIPADVLALLGEDILAEARLVIAGPGRTRWLRLSLREVDALAEAWAPYRPWVLADVPAAPVDAAGPAPVLGRLTHGLWSRLGVGALRDALSRPVLDDLGYRTATRRDHTSHPGDDDLDEDDEDDEDDLDDGSEGGGSALGTPSASGQWTLPVELARRCGVERQLVWAVYRDRRVHLTARRATPASVGPAALDVAFDDGAERWTRFVDAGPELLRASLVSAADPSHLPALRVRTGSRP